jgi:hypothetical protein
MNSTNHETQIGDQKALPPIFMGLALHIFGGKGHVLTYHKALGEALKLNGWIHLAVVSPDPKLPDLPREWSIEYIDSGVLDHEGIEIKRLLKRLNFWAFIKSMYILGRDFTGVLRKEIEFRPNKKIIFLECFNPLQLLSVILSLLFVKRDRLSIWLLHRGGPDWGGRKYRVMARSYTISFKIMTPMIELLVGRDNLVLLTDSETLVTTLSKYYKRTFHLVPIPHMPGDHADHADHIKDTGSHDRVVCWWPGTPRAEKGTDIIQRLASIKDRDAYKVVLIAAKSANLTVQDGCSRIETVDDKLVRQDYENRFFTSDLILLPYDRDIYSESTSGIFTECIVAGATPLVTRDTWMAYELEKMGLGELAIDWESDLIVQQIISLATNDSIKQKIREMQAKYRSFHSIPSFARTLDSLYKLAPLS